jgi:hypothetical protein
VSGVFPNRQDEPRKPRLPSGWTVGKETVPRGTVQSLGGTLRDSAIVQQSLGR